MSERCVVVLGADGQLGHELCRTLAPLGKVVGLGRRNPALAFDLQSPAAACATIAGLRPALLVNAAAYTQVDKAESEPALAHALNAEAVGALGACAARLGIPFVHYSTDYVFDGNATHPYTEDHPTAPLNVYGASKLAGEQALHASGAASVVLRTSWVYAGRGQNFLRTMLRLAASQPRLRVVADQHGAPTWARSLAGATALMVAKLGFDSANWRPHHGVYHLTNAGHTTWHGFAQAILDIARDWPGVIAEGVEPIPTSDYPTPAARPRYSVLDNGKFKRAFNLALEPWDVALKLCMADLSSH